MIKINNSNITNVYRSTQNIKRIYRGIELVYKKEEELTGTITMSNNNGLTLTNQDVTVTLTTNLAINTPNGWTKEDNTIFTKVFSSNIKTSVTVTTLDNSQSITISFEVKRIDKTAPEISIKTGETETIVSGDAYEVISFKLYDANGMTSYTLNSRTVALNGAQWSDINYVKIGSMGGIEGNNILTVTDKAGNKATFEFKLIAGD